MAERRRLGQAGRTDDRVSLGPTEPALAGTEPIPSASGGTLSARALRGSVWTFAGYGTSLALRLGGNLILTRLLTADAFGLMSLVGVFLAGLDMFSDLGVGPSIVQTRRAEDKSFLDTAWTLQVARGFALWAIACAIAWPLAWLYGEPTLTALIVVLGASVAIGGLASIKLFTANRKLMVGRLTLLDLITQVLGLAVMVIWAWLHPSVWALVGGALVSGLSRCVLSHVALPGVRVRLHWDRGAAASLLHFGKWILLSTLLTFLAGQADRLVFGKLVSLEMLGVYSIGLMIASLPPQLLGQLSNAIVFPAYAEIVNRGQSLGPQVARVRPPLMMGAGLVFSGLVAAGPQLIEIVYDPRYRDAGWVVQLLGVGGWFFALEMTNGAALLAIGEARWVAAASGAKVLSMIVSIPLGFWLGGFPGAVLGYAAAEVARYAASAYAVAYAGMRGWPLDLWLTGVGALACTAGVACSSALAEHGAFLRLLVASAAASLPWLVAFGAWLGWRGVWQR